MTDKRLMTCEEALRVLAELLDGELQGGAEHDLQEHLARCRSCFSRAEFERRLKGQVAAIRESAVPAALEDRIRRLLERFPASSDRPGAGEEA